MAKKTLNEAVVRRFQKLANVAVVNESYHSDAEEQKMEEAVMEAEEAEMEAEEEVGEEAEEEAGEEAEMEAEEAEEEEAEETDLELTDEEAQAIIDLGAKLAAAMSDEAEEEEEEAGEEVEMEMDAGEAQEMPMSDELMETLSEVETLPANEEIINEVARRVAIRLQEAKKAEKAMNEALGRK